MSKTLDSFSDMFWLDICIYQKNGFVAKWCILST